jgi:hypothetical protein
VEECVREMWFVFVLPKTECRGQRVNKLNSPAVSNA